MADREHYERDSWDDHPATGDGNFGAEVKILALKPSVPKAAPKKHETLWQKIAHFVAHPIKTLKGEAVKTESGMHGPVGAFGGLPSRNATLASQMDQPSFFQGAPTSTKASWWESAIGDRMEWDR